MLREGSETAPHTPPHGPVDGHERFLQALVGAAILGPASSGVESVNIRSLRLYCFLIGQSRGPVLL